MKGNQKVSIRLPKCNQTYETSKLKKTGFLRNNYFDLVIVGEESFWESHQSFAKPSGIQKLTIRTKEVTLTSLTGVRASKKVRGY